MKILYTLYLKLTQILMRSFILEWIGVRKERVQAWRDKDWKGSTHFPKNEAHVLFHAASVGELEILIPIIHEFSARKIKNCGS